MLRLRLGDGPLRLLCLGAHPDDIEIGCGGTVLRLLAERRDVAARWVVFSGVAARRREAEASAAEFLAGAASREIAVAGFRDGFFPFEGAAIKEEFERLKAGWDPTLILTHYKGDAHQDHRLVADLTYNTWRDCLILEYEIPKVEGDLGNPSIFIPLERSVADRKIGLVMKHFASQRGRSWFDEETFRAALRLRGVNANAPSGYAEAFHCRRAVI
jgi:LmbE family N-acetylglucosaminyl deacetylase